MSGPQLNKRLWTEISKLKNLHGRSGQKFILDKSPFDGLDDDEEVAAASASAKELVIIGRILPKSDPYKEGAYQIEIKLTSHFPTDPPQVKFLTKIYHPNIGKDGEFSHELLGRTSRWTPTTSLVDVIRAVIKHVDEPAIDYTLSIDLAREYIDNRPEFNRKAAEYVRRYALPRS